MLFLHLLACLCKVNILGNKSLKWWSNPSKMCYSETRIKDWGIGHVDLPTAQPNSWVFVFLGWLFHWPPGVFGMTPSFGWAFVFLARLGGGDLRVSN